MVGDEAPTGVKRDTGKRRFEQSFMLEAFSRGVRSATGHPFTVPRADVASLDDAIDANSPPGGTGVRERWVEGKAAAWTRWRLSQPEAERKFYPATVAGMVKWLNAGAPAAPEPDPPQRTRYLMPDGKEVWVDG
jgi:hypothetical protein